MQMQLKNVDQNVTHIGKKLSYKNSQTFEPLSW